MLRKILIPLDASERTPVAVSTAAHIARDVREVLHRDVVDLEGLGIVDLDQIPSGRFANMVPRQEILAEARQSVDDLLAGFRERARQEGLPDENIHTHHTEGSPFQKIMHHHVFCDLLVMGEACSFPPVHNDYNTLEELYHRASRPILLTPRAPRSVDTVLMVMDGTAPSSRMMYSYAHLNPFPNARLLVTHSRFEEDYHNLKDFFDRVEDYLRAFRFPVERVRIDGHLLDELPGLVESYHVGAVALGVHAEHFLDRLRHPLQLTRTPVEKLLQQTQALLFTVH